jgi:hypothetical protein
MRKVYMRQHRARLNAHKYTTVKAPGGRTKRVPIIKVSVSHKSPPEEFQVEGRRKKKRGFVPVMKEIFKKKPAPTKTEARAWACGVINIEPNCFTMTTR